MLRDYAKRLQAAVSIPYHELSVHSLTMGSGGIIVWFVAIDRNLAYLQVSEEAPSDMQQT